MRSDFSRLYEDIPNFKKVILIDLNQTSILVNSESGDPVKNRECAAYRVSEAIRKTLQLYYLVTTGNTCRAWSIGSIVDSAMSNKKNKDLYSGIPSLIRKNGDIYTTWSWQDFSRVKVPSKRSIIAAYTACFNWINTMDLKVQ